MQLTPRKREILRRVIEEYVATGQPVGSRVLVERSGLAVSSSTVRNELAELETLGLLTHPHTSAGRTPTESGYRIYAEELVDTLEGRPDGLGVDLRPMRDEIERALRATTEMLSDATRLLALVSAPSLETASIRHIEVLRLQPTTVMVVVITSTGGVTKRMFRLQDPVDPGVVAWAGELSRGAARGRAPGLADGSTPARRARAVTARALVPRAHRTDAARGRGRGRAGGLRRRNCRSRRGRARGRRGRGDDAPRRAPRAPCCGSRAAERGARAAAAGGARRAGGGRGELRAVSLVGATYGIRSTPLGAVGLVGPLRMDYEKAIRTVRAAAFELSRVEDVYEDA